ncbi:hypothetical protein SCHPADRAFT_994007 [Schizopora paradoxa]|uniref:Uncharacterized protein n=1 Tax=Schizopora paradoxa TaxID=27342 RepID=A0A0H2S1F5_9AGAM|nr:hypothetical protein SCHPADRAFT_994007 [Schizopora paradoxa]
MEVIDVLEATSHLKALSIKTHSGSVILLKDGMKNFESTPRAFPSKRPSAETDDVPNFSRPFTEFYKRKSFCEQAVSAMKYKGFDSDEDDTIQIGPTSMSMGWPYKFSKGDIAVALFNGSWRKVRVRSDGVATERMLDDALFHDPDYQETYKEHAKFMRTYKYEMTSEDDSEDAGILWYRASWKTSEGKFFAWFSPLTGRIKPYNAYVRELAKTEKIKIIMHASG